MICPECAKVGMTSRVYPGVGSQTLVYYPPFYDEQGRYHDHDRNTTTTDYTCSNGHVWAEARMPEKCWCGWPEAKEGK